MIHAAYSSGVRRFDGAIKGFGGCPMATDVLTGNLATETLIAHCVEHQVNTGIDMDAIQYAQEKAASIFNFYH